MKTIVFVTSHGYLPQKVGGSEWSTHELCKALKSRGYKVCVLSVLIPGDFLSIRLRLKGKVMRTDLMSDNAMGYTTYRVWNVAESLPKLVKKLKPDWVVIQAGKCIELAKIALQAQVKTAVYVRDVEFANHGGTYFTNPMLRYITNSKFTSKKLKDSFDIESTAIPPMVDYSPYKVEKKGENVVFICPFPEKGVEIATKLAEKNPAIPFVFVESWTFTDKVRAYLQKNVTPLANVQILNKQLDMKSVYSLAKIIIIPSQWEEAWGRVASEGQVSGIPIIASKIGGLVESVGDGGLLIDPHDDVEKWNQALNKLWNDQDYYQLQQQKAVQYSKRSEIAMSKLTDNFIVALS